MKKNLLGGAKYPQIWHLTNFDIIFGLCTLENIGNESHIGPKSNHRIFCQKFWKLGPTPSNTQNFESVDLDDHEFEISTLDLVGIDPKTVKIGQNSRFQAF